MAQPEIAHGLDRRAATHEATRLVAEKMVQHGRCTILQHFHAAKERAGIKIFLSHIPKRCTVISAPNLQGLARHHPTDEIRRRVAVGIHHARHGDSPIGSNSPVEGTWGRPFSGSTYASLLPSVTIEPFSITSFCAFIVTRRASRI